MRAARLTVLFALLVALQLPAGCGDPPASAPADPGAEPYGLDGAPRVPIPAPAGRRRPNLVLVVLDTLRADALDLGGPRGVMPRLRARAARGVGFSEASAPAPWTQPSLSSLMTGVLPSRHGVSGEDLMALALNPLATWAEILRHALGYATVAWVGGPWSNARGQLLEGFEQAVPKVMLQGVGPLIDRFAASRDPSRPFFLFLHSFEVHDPYGEANHPFPPLPPVLDPALDPVAPLRSSLDDAELARRSILDRVFHAYLWRSPAYAPLQDRVIRYQWSGLAEAPRPDLVAELRAAYDAGARWVDGLLEAALERLAGHGLLGEDTLLIVTSDHGEAFGEHGQLLHGRQLYDELLRVPLVLAGPPPFAGGRVLDDGVSLLDLLPTCLDWLGAPVPSSLDGRSFLGRLSGASSALGPALAEEVRTRRRTGGAPPARLLSVRTPAWKALWTQDTETGQVREEAYDLRADPAETRDLAAPHGRLPPQELPPELRAAVERARDRFWDPRVLPAPAGPSGPRPSPLPAAPR